MKQQRIHLIDGMRGLSLFGILLANLLIFQYGIFGKDELSLTGIDNGAFQFIKIFIEGSFMPIFTFLFGYSIIKMAEGLKQKNVKIKRYFIRRFILLLAIGFLHGIFLWEGDILTFYGGMGLLLLLFVNRKKKTILIWGVLLFMLTNAFMLIGGGVESTGEMDDGFNVSPEYIEKTNEVYATGTYSEISDHRNNEDPFVDTPGLLLLIMVILAPIASAPLFLFGMYAARANFFTKPSSELKWYQIGTWILVPIGLSMKAFGELASYTSWTDFLIGCGAPLLSLGYICGFAYVYTKFHNTVPMLAFKNVGKLSLTNYLMQTVICTTIFYGYGFGLFGKLGVLNSILLGLVIFVVQCICSHYYLKVFSRGPVEIVLRMWTNFSWNGRVKEKEGYPHVDNPKTPLIND